MDIIGLILFLLKAISITLAGIFGILGLLINFKEKNGKITKGGRKALVIILISTFVAMITQSFEFYKEIQSQKKTTELALNEIKRTEKTLKQIERSLYPIETISASYYIELPTEDKDMKNYFKLLDDNIRFFIKKWGQYEGLNLINYDEWKKNNIFPSGLGAANDQVHSIFAVEIKSGSSFLPDPIKSKLQYFVLCYSGIQILFFKNSMQIDNHPILDSSSGFEADLSLSFESGLKNSGILDEHSIDYILSSKTSEINASQLRSNSEYWRSNGKIISIPDLFGSQMAVRIRSSMGTGDKNIDLKLERIRKKLSLKTLYIIFGKGIEYRFRENDFEIKIDGDGFPVYFFTFPTNSEEMDKLKQ